MPIIISDASKLVIKPAAEPQIVTAPPRPQEEAVASSIAAKAVIGDGTRLFVNGKERKIGKKSQYLLDMLTLED